MFDCFIIFQRSYLQLSFILQLVYFVGLSTRKVGQQRGLFTKSLKRNKITQKLSSTLQEAVQHFLGCHFKSALFSPVLIHKINTSWTDNHQTLWGQLQYRCTFSKAKYLQKYEKSGKQHVRLHTLMHLDKTEGGGTTRKS